MRVTRFLSWVQGDPWWGVTMVGTEFILRTASRWRLMERVFISQLRRKIEPDPTRPKIIATDPGIGYRWLLRAAEETEQLTS